MMKSNKLIENIEYSSLKAKIIASKVDLKAEINNALSEKDNVDFICINTKKDFKKFALEDSTIKMKFIDYFIETNLEKRIRNKMYEKKLKNKIDVDIAILMDFLTTVYEDTLYFTMGDLVVEIHMR